MPKKHNKIKGRPKINFDDAEFNDGDIEDFVTKPDAKSPGLRPQFMGIWKGADGFSNSPNVSKKPTLGASSAENPAYISDSEDGPGDRRISMLPNPTEGSGSLKRKDSGARNGVLNGTNETMPEMMTVEDELPEAPPRKKSLSAQAAEKLASLKRKMSRADGAEQTDGAVTFIKRTDIGDEPKGNSDAPAAKTNGEVNGEANGEANGVSSNDDSSDKSSDHAHSDNVEADQPAAGESPSDSELSTLSQVSPGKADSSPEHSPKASVADVTINNSPKPSPPGSQRPSTVDQSGSTDQSQKVSITEPSQQSPSQSPRQSVGSTSPKGSITTPPKLSPPPSNTSSPKVSPVGSANATPRQSLGSLSISPKATPRSSFSDPLGATSADAGASASSAAAEERKTSASSQKSDASSNKGGGLLKAAAAIGVTAAVASAVSNKDDEGDEKDSNKEDEKPTKPIPPPKPIKSALKKPAALSIWQDMEKGKGPEGVPHASANAESINGVNAASAANTADDIAGPQDDNASVAGSVKKESTAEMATLSVAPAGDNADGPEGRKGSYEPILPFFPTTQAKTTEVKQESAPAPEEEQPLDYLSSLSEEGPRRLNKAKLKKIAEFVPPRSTSTSAMPDPSKLQAVGKSKLEKGPDDDSLASSEESSEQDDEEEEDDEDYDKTLQKKVSKASPPMIRKAQPPSAPKPMLRNARPSVVSFAAGLKDPSSSSEESEIEDAETLAKREQRHRKMTPSSNKKSMIMNDEGELVEDIEAEITQAEVAEGEEDPLLGEDGEPGKKKKKKKELDFEYRIKKWDVFLTSPVGEDNSARDQCYETGMKIMKIMYIILSFIICLGLVVMNKVTLTLAASNSLPPFLRDTVNATILPDNNTKWANPTEVTFERTWYCSQYAYKMNTTLFPGQDWHNVTNCVAVPPRWIVSGFLSDENINVDQFTCLRERPRSDKLPYNHKNEMSAKMYSSHSVRWTWCLWLMIATPEFFVFFRCLWRLMFKKKNTPKGWLMFRMILLETIQTIGQCILIFRVLPRLDHSAGAVGILTSVAFIPSLLSCFIVDRSEEDYNDTEAEEGCIHRIFNRFCSEYIRKIFILVMNFVCMGLQAVGLLFFPIFFQFRDELNINWHGPFQEELQYTIPISLFLVSMTWWLNYIGDDFRWGKLARSLDGFRKKVKKTRTKIYVWASLWKIIVSFCCMIASYSYDYGKDSDFGEGKSWTDIGAKIFQFNDDHTESYDGYTMIGVGEIGRMRTDFVFVWLVNTFAGLVVYFLCRTAAKVHIQFVCYALPLMLSTPVSIGSMLGFCEHWSYDPCFFSGAAPAYLFWQCPVQTDTKPDIPWYIWIFFAFWLSQYWIAAHIWKPMGERLAQTDKLFLFPLFNGTYLEQWLLHNRNRKDKGVQSSDSRDTTSVQRLEDAAKMDVTDPKNKNKKNMNNQMRSRAYSTVQNTYIARRNFIRDNTPKVIICATMWHETEQEMIQMLNSMFKLDMDQNIRKNVQELLGTHDEDYYEFEANIFFDDAFEYHDEYSGNEYNVNDYVKMLIAVMDTAASHVHQVNMRVEPPVKYPTPYGGRLEWTMPGGNKIVAHIKDKFFIRHKKRWSQVMYMYYFLGFKLWSQTKDIKRKEILSDNTFILALDGDVDFEPSAMLLLLDLMKKNLKVGAACGRIHPTGSGLMVWYQKFEYALGHWMQKATEHVLGCVLCSPGCFSLFRGSAIMDENVMKKYTTIPTEAQHFVQYDQGEDRWLCTLLLQQGYKVEYSAASDSFTFAPEDFKEFFQQRRRWGPSTMANVIDLLMSWRHTVKNNENISFLYITYQTILMASSIIGSGSIFLMIVGALDVALNNALGTTWSFILNLVPVLLFIFFCFCTKSDTQLALAQALTVIYSLIQMLVLVGIIIQMADEGPCSPTAIFFMYVAGTFIFAALIHPQESFCVVYGFLYYMLIPSMYMLLMIYSLTNLNNVSWGTREVKKSPLEMEMEAETQKKKAEEKEDTSVLNWMKGFVNAGDPDNQSWTCSLGECFRCVCCPKKEFDNAAIIVQTQEQIKQLVQEGFTKIASGEDIPAQPQDPNQPFKPKSILKKGNAPKSAKKKKSQGRVKIREDAIRIMDYDEFDSDSDDDKKLGPQIVVHRDPLINPYWVENTELVGKGPLGKLNETETQFFQDLIERYLKPIPRDLIKEDKDKQALLDLRNKVSFSFFMINAVYVTVIFTLQENVDQISVRWPCGSTSDGRPLNLEPIGFMFLFIFGTILVLQTVGMIVHRAGTFLHLMATTNLTFGAKDSRGGDAVFSELYDLMADMARMSPDDDDKSTIVDGGHDDEDNDGVKGKRKGTIRNIRKAEKQTMKTWKNTKHNVMAGTMNEKIMKRLGKLKEGIEGDTDIQTLAKIVSGGDDKARRKSIGFLKNMDKIRQEENRKPSMAGHRKSVVFFERPIEPDYEEMPDDYEVPMPEDHKGNRRFKAHSERRESVMVFKENWKDHEDSPNPYDIYESNNYPGSSQRNDDMALDMPEQDYSDSDDDTKKEIEPPGGYRNLTHNWLYGEPGFDDVRYGDKEDLIDLEEQPPVAFRPTKPSRPGLRFDMDQSGF